MRITVRKINGSSSIFLNKYNITPFFSHPWRQPSEHLMQSARLNVTLLHFFSKYAHSTWAICTLHTKHCYTFRKIGKFCLPITKK